MNYTTILENWLKEYNTMKLQLASLKELYADTEKGISEGHAIDYSKDKLSQSYKINSEVENIALELVLIRNKIDHLTNKIEVIENGIEGLSTKEKRIIELRYIDRKRIKYTDQYRNYTWREISEMVGYYERHCRRIKDEGIAKLVKNMFGIKNDRKTLEL